MSALLEVAKSIAIKAPPDQVWNLLKDFYSCWIDGIAVIQLGPGLREMPTPDGGSVIERLIDHSDEKMAMTYALVEGALPVRNYTSVLSVHRTDDGPSATVDWRCTFEAHGVPDAQAEAIIAGLYEMGLQALAHKCEAA